MLRSLHIKVLALPMLVWSSLSFANSLTLQDVLQAALEKQRHNSNQSIQVEALDAPTDSILASPPSVSLLYLHNQDSQGSKEAEVSLNFPIKSKLQRDLDKQLRSTTPLVRQQALQQQTLFISGLIRYYVWEIKLQQLYLKQNEQKVEVLNSLLNRFEKLSAAGSSPVYLPLLIKQESIQSNLSLLQHKQKLASLMSQYKQFTGLTALPQTIDESSIQISDSTVTQHPDIQAMDVAWQLSEAQFKVASNKASPWNVSVTAKTIDSPGFTENQLGIGVEVPLNLGNNFSQSQYSLFDQTRVQYELERSKLYEQINLAISNAQSSLKLAQQQQTLLNEALGITGELQPILEQLMASNTSDQEWILRRTLEIVDTQSQFAENKIIIQKNIATLNQVAGKSL